MFPKRCRYLHRFVLLLSCNLLKLGDNVLFVSHDTSIFEKQCGNWPVEHNEPCANVYNAGFINACANNCFQAKQLSNLSFLKEECKAYLPQGYQQLAEYKTLHYLDEEPLRENAATKEKRVFRRLYQAKQEGVKTTGLQ